MSKYDNEREVIYGQKLQEGPTREALAEDAFITVAATSGANLPISLDILSKHILNLGSIGSGKTNCMLQVLSTLMGKLTPRDRMVIFDAKGDYEREFRRDNDIVIGSASGRNRTVWNLFADLMETPQSSPDAELLRQIATALFREQIETSQNPTFPSGARDLFVGLTLAFIRRAQQGGNASWETLNNETLKRFFTGEVRDPARIADLIAPHPDLQWMRMYILAPQSATTQSYLAPLQAMVNEMFIGCFARTGAFSIRRYIREGGNGRLFISYDAEIGVLMDAMYTVLLDLAMRQSIGREAVNGGSIYYVLDELPMLPPLAYLDSLLNFGRSLGVKIIAGMQNTSQMDDRYGESRATSILSGFSTYFCFHLFDEKSRDIVKQRHGTNVRRISSLKRNGKDDVEMIQTFDVIEDADIVNLYGGRCIVSMPMGEPFMFHPMYYQTGEGGLPTAPNRPQLRILPRHN